MPNQASDESTLLRLGVQLTIVQQVIVRYRRVVRVRVFSIILTTLGILGGLGVLFLARPPVKVFAGIPIAIVTVASIVLLIYLSGRPLASPEECRFLDISDALTIRDFELMLLEIRAQRRTIPQVDNRNYQNQYQDETSLYVDDLRARGIRSRRANNIVQLITIIGSLAATALGSLAIANPNYEWTSPVVTFIVGSASGVAAIYKFKDRSFYAQQTANSIDQELSAFNLGIGRYAINDLRSEDQARVDLVEEVHRLRTEQENREQNLDQPSQRNAEND